MPYADETKVSVERSTMELVAILKRYGATQTAIIDSTDPPASCVMFRYRERPFRLSVPVPPIEEFIYDKRRVRRSPKSRDNAWSTEQRRRWRVMVLLVKAQLEAVDCGLLPFEAAMAHALLLPDGRTAGEAVVADLDGFLAGGGRLPLLLLGPDEREA